MYKGLSGTRLFQLRVGFIGYWYFHNFLGSGLTGFIFNVRVFGFLGSRVGTSLKLEITQVSFEPLLVRPFSQ